MNLVEQLEVVPVGADRYRGDNPVDRWNSRVFGGLVAAQALRSAGETVVSEQHPHSLHGYFLRGGAPGVPIEYRVERVRDGRSFATRTVEAVQRGEVIFTLTASFHRDEPGAEYQLAMPTGVAHPTTLPPGGVAPYRRDEVHMPFDRCEMGPDPSPPGDAEGRYRASRRAWLRASESLPDNSLVHACALVYATDMMSVSSSAVAVGLRYWEQSFRDEVAMSASLDHSVWYHRPVRVDEWFYVEHEAVSNQGSRGLMRGSVFDERGRLVASLTQEALLRLKS